MPGFAARLQVMQREQKITLGEMRESGPTRLIVYCADCKCAHSVVIDAGRWAMTCGFPILSLSSAAGHAVTAAPMSGRSSSADAWGLVRSARRAEPHRTSLRQALHNR